MIDTTALTITGTLTEPDPTTPGSTVRVVYQRTAPGCGNIAAGGAYDRQRRLWVKPADPLTAAQYRRRQVMKAAALYYATMPALFAARIAQLRDTRRITTQQAFAAAFAEAQAPAGASLWDASYSRWDNGASQWDGGATRFDALPLSVWDDTATLWTA